MASLEFIQKRIEGKEKEIATLEKKIERILKAQASNWENNPYYYNESDLKWAQRDLDKAREALEEYKTKLSQETEKAASRDIPVILEFLDQWKERTTEWYHDAFEKYLVAREEWYKYDREYTEWSNRQGYKTRQENREEYDRRVNERRRKSQDFKATWAFLDPYYDRAYNSETGKYEPAFNDVKFQKDINEEANRKYDFIVESTNKIVGQITDASNLKVGSKGDLNGYIIGTRGKAKIQTVGAGGYNENVILDSGRHGQRFHFRTLITPIKD